MLQSKDIHSIQELSKIASDPEKKVNYLLDYLKFFDFKIVYRGLNSLKRRGYSMSSILSILVILPFINQASIHALLRSGSKNMAEGEKDVFYRGKNRQDIDWRRILTSFANRFLSIIEKNGNKAASGLCCLILDDSFLQKAGFKFEFIGRVFDHVSHRFLIGYKALVLCYYDGISTIPIDFSFHREKGKDAKKPFGLTKAQFKKQRKCKRKEGGQSYVRAKEVDESKIKIGIQMLKRAMKYLTVDYVLMDSWFTSEAMIECVRGKVGRIKQNASHLIGMMKMGNAKYTYNNNLYDAKTLLTHLKRTQKISKCKKLGAAFIIADVLYKEYPVRIYFSRFGQRGKWHLVLSTDATLNYEAMMAIYHIRWSIEVFFHEAKGFLNLGKCQSTTFEAQIAETTITMIQYILLTLKKRFDDYETRGAIFREAQEDMQERKLHVRLWGLLLAIVKSVIESLDVIIDDIDLVITKIINDKELWRIADLAELKKQT
jgi:hypothetical protein